jgi:hypothetical protein
MQTVVIRGMIAVGWTPSIRVVVRTYVRIQADLESLQQRGKRPWPYQPCLESSDQYRASSKCAVLSSELPDAIFHFHHNASNT